MSRLLGTLQIDPFEGSVQDKRWFTFDDVRLMQIHGNDVVVDVTVGSV